MKSQSIRPVESGTKVLFSAYPSVSVIVAIVMRPGSICVELLRRVLLREGGTESRIVSADPERS
jgi:hypothetical protein